MDNYFVRDKSRKKFNSDVCEVVWRQSHSLMSYLLDESSNCLLDDQIATADTSLSWAFAAAPTLNNGL